MQAMNDALAAADAAHGLERAFLHIAECMRRGEVPNRLTAGMIPGQLERIRVLLDLLPLPEADAKEG